MNTKARLLLAFVLFLALPAIGQMWEATRIGQQQWELVSDAGDHISWHQSEGEAVEKGQKWSIENDFKSYTTRHTGTRWDATAFAQSYPSAENAGVDTVAEGGGADSVSTFTALHKGDSTGQLVEISTTSIDITGEGTWDHEPDLAYQTCADTGDCQVKALIPDSSNWTGNIQTYTGFGVGISEGAADGDYFAQTWLIPQGNARWKRGVPSSKIEEISASGHQAFYLAVTYDQSASELRGWFSTDDINYTQIGSTVSKTLSCTAGNCIAYVFGTSANTGSGTLASTTSIAIVTTLTILPPEEEQPATIFISDTGNDTTGNGTEGNPYATLAKAASVANPNDIIEAQKNGTGTWTYTAYTTIMQDGISGSPITFRVRSGDTFNAYPSGSGSNILKLDSASFWRIDGSEGELNISDPSLWSSSGGGSNSAYPNNTTLTLSGGQDQEIGNIDFGGGTGSNIIIIASSDNVYLHDVTLTGYGKVNSTSRSDNGVLVTDMGDFRAERLTLTAPAGGHNMMQMTAGGPYVVRESYFDNDWETATGLGEGYRAIILSPGKDEPLYATAPIGTNQPMLFENNVIRNVTENSSSQTVVSNIRGNRVIVRYNYVFDTTAAGSAWFSESFDVTSDNRNQIHRIYNNTHVNIANVSRVQSYGSSAAGAKNNFKDLRRYNNIWADVTATVSETNSFPHQDRIISVWFDDDTASSQGFNLQGCADYWLCAKFVGNMIDSDGYDIFVSPTTGGSGGTEVTTLASAISTWPNVFAASNNTNAPTFVSEANARAATTVTGVAAGFALAGGSNGIDEAEPLAEMSAGSSGTTFTMDDTAWIYDGFTDGDEENRDYIAVYDSGGCTGSLKGIRRVVANSISSPYTTVQVEVALTVVSGDTVFPVLLDGATVVCNIGAAQ